MKTENFNLENFVLILSVFVNVGIAILIIIQSKFRNYINLSFTGIIVGIVGWVFANYQIDLVKDHDQALVWTKISGVGIILFLSSLFIFARIYPEGKLKKMSTLTITTLIGLAFSIVSMVTNLIVMDVNVTVFPAKVQYGPGYYLLIAYILVLIVLSLGTIFQKYRASQSSTKNQLLLLFVSFFVVIFISIATNLVLPILGISTFTRIGPLSTIWFCGLTFLLIVKYKLFDIRIFVGRVAYYGLLSVIVLVTYRLVLVVNSYIWGSALDPRGMITGAVFAFVFVIFYDYFRKFVQSRISSVLINPGFEPNEVIVNFNKTISTLLDYEEIAELLDQTVTKTIRPTFISVFVKLKEKDKVILKTQSNQEEVTLNYDNIYKLWESSAFIPIFLDQIEIEVPRKFSAAFHELSLVVEEMRQKGIKIIFPIGVKENSNGILVLGTKESDSSYNSVQLKYLESLCEITALALMRAKLYEEVQEFNQTLQQKVKDATLEIQSQNSKLSEALRVERDMLDVLGHELRTPLGTIRNAMGVMDLKYKNKQFTDIDLEGFLKVGTENIRREIQLLETILASAKIDNDKLDMNFEKVDSNDVIADSFEAYKYDAEKKGLKLIQTLPAETIIAYADRLRIQQVMDNLVSNSIKYTEKGQIEMKVEEAGKYVKFSITDTGEGIPEEDIAKLGTKFFRANMYLKSEGKLGDRRIVRPGGTGIGLYVVYQIVKYMYGEVKVFSKIGEGSTFSFTVLKYTPELENRSSFILTGKDSIRTYNEESRVLV